MTYKPRLDDYVKWNRSSGSIDEGWVYFMYQMNIFPSKFLPNVRLMKM